MKQKSLINRPTISIKLPINITRLDPNLSSNLPITGTLMAIVITRGSTIKLAVEVDSDNAVIANEGKNTIAT